MSDNLSVEEILKNIGPVKSEKAYESLWQDFISFANTYDPKLLEEVHFIRYFHHLKQLDLKSSTLWTKYSMLNNTFQRMTGEKLQKFPRLTLLLKSYQRGYTRKVAQTFTLQEFQTFIRKDLPSNFWIIRKAFAAIAWCGGLRCEEMHKLTPGCLTWTDNGCCVTFQHAKQLAEAKENSVLIPFNKNDPSLCLATKIQTYLDALGELAQDQNGKLFRCCPGQNFTRSPMGINFLRSIGKDVAQEIGLPNANLYTGHCWRRSCATQLAGQGATTVDLKRQFGWKQETTAMRYIDRTLQHQVKMASLTTGQQINKVNNVTMNGPAKPQEGKTFRKEDGDGCKIYHIYTGDNCNITLS